MQSSNSSSIDIPDFDDAPGDADAQAARLSAYVQAIIAEALQVPLDAVAADAFITHDLGADSLDVVALAMRFEHAFSISVEPRDYVYLFRLCDATSYIRGRMLERVSPPDVR